MTREMLKMVKESKQRAAELVRYANPKSKSKPSIEHITEILTASIPYKYSEGKPVITSFNVTRWNVNHIIRSARFQVETSNGKTWKIDAYEQLKGRTTEEKEYDKTATFPSGLFNIYHSEIAV